MKPYRIACLLVLFLLVFSVNTSYAYIDPGSGSIIMTALLGIIAAAGYYFRIYVHKIKRFFGKKAGRGVRKPIGYQWRVSEVQ